MKRLIALCTLASSLNLASAGEFVIASYGNVQAKDVQDLVTDGFTARFPADAWEIFIYSTAFTMKRRGQAICHAIVGVIPRRTYQFPRHHFSITRTATIKLEQWNDTEALAFETGCVRSAIINMMDIDPNDVHHPYKF
ncbi:hypothetical protein [Verminephrobacter aporrectodeae]|uniref:hypothetical protein n=1 Tax=Verminephrobacter aporrectodeae TaxID=1110389 RepID=UPI0002375AC8|nr:hypothetical protein [Verminephrobacter aporrectodeae]